MEVPDAVVALLRAQGGTARRRDVLAAGLSRRGLARAVREGELRSLTPHLVRVVGRPGPWEALRSAVVALEATASHTSAALLWGIELRETPAVETVIVARDRSRLSLPGVRVRRVDLDDEDVVERDGLRVTTVLRTLLDLCRTLPLVEAVVAVDSALRQELVTVEELTGALRELPPARGRPAVARVLGLADPASGSVLESLCRVLLTLAGLPPEETQLLVRGRRGRIGRVDFAWPSARLVVEVDGFAFHADRASYREDRRRGNGLVLAGWRVLRFSWEDVVGSPERVVADVRAALTGLAVA